MSTRILLLIALLVVPLHRQVSAQDDPRTRLTQLIDDGWEFTLRENPIFATTFGDRRFDNQLGDESLANQRRRAETRKAMLKRWEAIPRA